MEPTTFAVAQSNTELTGSTETIDAATYLTSVETQFQDKPEVYRNFIELMQDFNGQKWAPHDMDVISFTSSIYYLQNWYFEYNETRIEPAPGPPEANTRI